MGIAISELMKMEYFKDFYILAGKKGLHKEVQGVTVLEAPDAFKWSRGKELILSSGYVISKEPSCIQRAFDEGLLEECSAMMIKRGRYIDKIPDELLELFDRYEVPLISMPFSIPYMDVMNQINTAVMNRTIKRFKIQGGDGFLTADQSYKVQKIKKILQAVEVDMKFPAFLYDVNEKESYYSSANFQKITKFFGLKERDYWDPSQEVSKNTLCDYIGMVRYRLVNQTQPQEPRVSWIIMPIVMNNKVQAYFVVMESKEFIDFYDEYSIRIAFLMLQNVYEQVMVARRIGDIGFENYIHFALSYKEKDESKLVYQANMQGIDIHKKVVCILFEQSNTEISAREFRKELVETIRRHSLYRDVRIAFLESNEGLIILDSVEDEHRREIISDLINAFKQEMERGDEAMQLLFSLCCEEKPLLQIKSMVEKARRVMKMGKMLYPTQYVWSYEQLGALAWLDIPQGELDKMLLAYHPLLQDEKNIEMLKTLRVYLENNMNFSLTADKMFVHINTIRKRIEKVSSLIEIDWENYVSRLQVLILLQHLNL